MFEAFPHPIRDRAWELHRTKRETTGVKTLSMSRYLRKGAHHPTILRDNQTTVRGRQYTIYQSQSVSLEALEAQWHCLLGLLFGLSMGTRGPHARSTPAALVKIDTRTQRYGRGGTSVQTRRVRLSQILSAVPVHVNFPIWKFFSKSENPGTSVVALSTCSPCGMSVV